MAGMFYTLQEVIEKLGKTEAEIKIFVREGRLREFRDGAKQLYKTEDVDAILGSAKHDTAILDDSLQISIDETGEVSLAPEELDALMNQDTSKSKAMGSKAQLDETGELLAEETLGGTPKKPSKDRTRKPKADDEIELLPAESTNAGTKASTKAQSDSLSLIDSQKGASTSNDDTRITSGGDSINVLSESEGDFKISDDTSNKTKMMQPKPKALDEKGGGRLDDDVNLDGGGSGSGLLDLSLQADDTSLGAVLDDIYPETPAEQSPGTGAAVAEEAEKIIEQPEPSEITQGAMPQEAAVFSGAPGMSYAVAEPLPDSSSNVFGILLFVPLAVLLYTTIVVISGYKPILNLQLLSSIEPLIWYVVAGLGAVVILVALIGSFAGKGGPKKPKAPKEPKVKKVKPPKEKKGKKGAEQAVAP